MRQFVSANVWQCLLTEMREWNWKRNLGVKRRTYIIAVRLEAGGEKTTEIYEHMQHLSIASYPPGLQDNFGITVRMIYNLLFRLRLFSFLPLWILTYSVSFTLHSASPRLPHTHTHMNAQHTGVASCLILHEDNCFYANLTAAFISRLFHRHLFSNHIVLRAQLQTRTHTHTLSQRRTFDIAFWKELF